MNNTEFMTPILSAARKIGPMIEPSNLLNQLRSYETPLAILCEWDARHNIFSAFQVDVGLQFFPPPFPISSQVEAIVAGICRWFLDRLTHWQCAGDPQLQELSALLVIAQCFSLDKFLWDQIPDAVVENQELLGQLSRLIEGARINFIPHLDRPIPIWERDAVVRIERADSERDWVALDCNIRRVLDSLPPNLLLTQAIRMLCRFDFDRLVEASRPIQQFTLAAQAIEALTLEDGFCLATQTESPWVRFAAVYTGLGRHRVKEGFSPEAIQLLAALLVQIANDEVEWEKWMVVFNRYPLRYPELQEALGYALAVIPERALASYVESINLYRGNAGSRDAIAACLSKFRSEAEIDRRNYLWSLLYQRWDAWNFGAADPDGHLVEVSNSEIDYGVIGYLVDCADEVQREEIEQSLFDKLNNTDCVWHASSSACTSYFKRWLSRLQALTHAKLVIAEEREWLWSERYMTVALTKDRYLKMMYDI